MGTAVPKRFSRAVKIAWQDLQLLRFSAPYKEIHVTENVKIKIQNN